ncbi:hypothetical protein CK203_080079 [Vitis vinifera]|uniref:Integrase catalytic domain-containing protein n=1 Tax=Vitis vinifera TaxID=29760 RepID=A0A438D9T9_VITVI|nr:hypothetical protein CK203_080079 [Vitis vinifera]
MDIVGPLPAAPAQKNFLLVATNYFSKWVEAEAYASIKDKDVTKFVWKNIVCRFGIPQAIIADNGPQFDSIAFRNFYSELNIRNSYSTPRYPQRATGVLWAYRTTPRRPTGNTPFALAYGMEAVIPTEIDEVRESAAIRMADYQQKTIRPLQSQSEAQKLQNGTLVLRKIFENTTEVGAGKFQANWEGPYCRPPFWGSVSCTFMQLVLPGVTTPGGHMTSFNWLPWNQIVLFDEQSRGDTCGRICRRGMVGGFLESKPLEIGVTVRRKKRRKKHRAESWGVEGGRLRKTEKEAESEGFSERGRRERETLERESLPVKKEEQRKVALRTFSPDCAATSLLCGEDNNSLFDNADHGAAVEELETAWRHRSRRSRDQEKSFNGGEFFFIGLPGYSRPMSTI